MPTYDYVCRACDHEFELFQSMSENPKKKCPECGKLKLERLIGTGAAVLFKGSGFYETDYRSESYKKAQKADKPADSNSKSDGGKKDTAAKQTESKPSPKPADAPKSKAKQSAKPGKSGS